VGQFGLRLISFKLEGSSAAAFTKDGHDRPRHERGSALRGPSHQHDIIDECRPSHFRSIQKSIVYCAIIFNVANPPFSRTSEVRFQRGFLYGVNVGYYNSNTRIGSHAPTSTHTHNTRLPLAHDMRGDFGRRRWFGNFA
jgi:hypothetical protein